jgi:hypothetical protein
LLGSQHGLASIQLDRVDSYADGMLPAQDDGGRPQFDHYDRPDQQVG